MGGARGQVDLHVQRQATRAGLGRQQAAHALQQGPQRLRHRFQAQRPCFQPRVIEDVIEDLKRIAPVLGYSGYQPLIRAYVRQALRKDLERLDDDTVSAFVSVLKRRGVSNEIIKAALSEATRSENNHG